MSKCAVYTLMFSDVMFSYTCRSSGTLRVRLPFHCLTMPLRHSSGLHSSHTIAALFVSTLLSHVSHWNSSVTELLLVDHLRRIEISREP